MVCFVAVFSVERRDECSYEDWGRKDSTTMGRKEFVGTGYMFEDDSLLFYLDILFYECTP